MDTRQLVVVTGPPGAGKTTVARLVADRFDNLACVFESDWWWTTLLKGRIDPWLPEAHDQNRTVIRSVVASATAMVDGGYTTVLEGVIGPWMLDILTAGTESISGAVHYVVLRPTLDETVRRAIGRGGEERVAGHPALTDEEPIRHMWHEFSALGEFERYVIDTTGLDAPLTAEAVWARLQRGDLRLGAPQPGDGG